MNHTLKTKATEHRAAVWAAMLEGLHPAGQRSMVAAKLANMQNGQKASSANLQSTAVSQADAAETLNAGLPARWALIVDWLLGNGWPTPSLPVKGTLVHLCQDDPDPDDDDPLLSMTAIEIARMRGVSRQRGHQLLAAARAAADMRVSTTNERTEP
jgi:hypothetical protein